MKTETGKSNVQAKKRMSFEERMSSYDPKPKGWETTLMNHLKTSDLALLDSETGIAFPIKLRFSTHDFIIQIPDENGEIIKELLILSRDIFVDWEKLERENSSTN